MCVRLRHRERSVCRRRRDYEWERCGGFASLQGGGEVDFFSHPFFMAFLLSDLQSLYIRLTGRFSFIFKHLLGTQCVRLVTFFFFFSGGWWWRHGSRLRHAVFHQALMTTSPHWLLRCCSFSDVFRVLIVAESFSICLWWLSHRILNSKYLVKTMQICMFSTDGWMDVM